MTIILPKGYQPPEGAKPGEPFEAVASLVLADDGSFVLKTIDGVEIGESVEDAEPEQPSPFDFPEYGPEAPTF